MKNRHQLFASLLPIAAIGVLAIGTLGSADYMKEPAEASFEATTNEGAPRDSWPIRGARTAAPHLVDTSTSTMGETAQYEGHPRRPDGSRSLPDTGDRFDHEPPLTGPRGARG